MKILPTSTADTPARCVEGKWVVVTLVRTSIRGHLTTSLPGSTGSKMKRRHGRNASLRAQDGRKMLSENDKAGPEDSEAVGQAKTKQKGKPGPPPVARADPHRNRHWKDDQDPEAGSGSDLLTFDPNFHANRDIHPQVFVVASFPKVGHHR